MNYLGLLGLVLVGVSMIASRGVAESPSIVKIVPKGEGYELRRDGKPYFIRGAGGGDYLERLKAAGGNSIRTWGADEKTGELLDRAHRLGLTVTLGVWLGHERHGFKYDDPKMLQEQFEACRKWVRTYRSHPALLMWALGNEMEAGGDNPRIWKHINDLAQMVKREDPNHPTMTVIAEIGGPKIPMLQAHCPDIDVLGINSYGGMVTLGKRLKEAGWKKPFAITEFGPLGPWEVGKTKWNAPIEADSGTKADFYLQTYHAVIAPKGLCLGSYVFLWGEKMETTATWFGMFLKSGESVNSVDVMTYLWTGAHPVNRAPRITSVICNADKQEIAPGTTLTCELRVQDPDSDALRLKVEIVAEQQDRKEGGDAEATPPTVGGKEGVLIKNGAAKFAIPAPKRSGGYRLFLTVLDGKGHAATANIPFFVTP